MNDVEADAGLWRSRRASCVVSVAGPAHTIIQDTDAVMRLKEACQGLKQGASLSLLLDKRCGNWPQPRGIASDLCCSLDDAGGVAAAGVLLDARLVKFIPDGTCMLPMSDQLRAQDLHRCAGRFAT